MAQMMKNQEILRKLQQSGAFISGGHFEYTSGKHGDTYINKDAIYPHAELVSEICRVIAEEYKNDQVEAVIAPAAGGIVLSQWVSHWLAELTSQKVLACYADKRPKGGFIIKRGYDKLIAGKNTLILEDIINTGGSVKAVVSESNSAGAQVVGLGCIWNRGGVLPSELGAARLYSLVDIRLNVSNPGQCELCKQKIPLRKGIS
jgi:orotate phosphoribosyltransferase